MKKLTLLVCALMIGGATFAHDGKKACCKDHKNCKKEAKACCDKKDCDKKKAEKKA